MKFVSLGRERSRQTVESDQPSRATLESFAKPVAAPHQIHTYSELRHQIHEDLRIQNPEWIQPNGESPICDSYEARLMELLDSFTGTGSNESVAVVHRALEEGLNRIDAAAV
jgi:hypothetical protein